MADELPTAVTYQLSITRVRETPEKARAYGASTCYTSESVTTVTLDPDQWRKVQAAIVEALK